METLKQKQLRILNETALAYTISTRCTRGGLFGTCEYYKEGTQGCAVGRLIEDKELCKRFDSCKNEDGTLMESSIVSNDEVFTQLPEHIQELGKDFLRDLQLLHDSLVNWTNDGISDEGLRYVEEIKIHCKLN